MKAEKVLDKLLKESKTVKKRITKYVKNRINNSATVSSTPVFLPDFQGGKYLKGLYYFESSEKVKLQVVGDKGYYGLSKLTLPELYIIDSNLENLESLGSK